MGVLVIDVRYYRCLIPRRMPLYYSVFQLFSPFSSHSLISFVSSVLSASSRCSSKYGTNACKLNFSFLKRKQILMHWHCFQSSVCLVNYISCNVIIFSPPTSILDKLNAFHYFSSTPFCTIPQHPS